VELLPIVGIALLFWFMIIRPQSRQRKAALAMQASLEPGTEVMLTSGVYGTVSRVADDKVWVDVAPGVTLTVAKGAIGQVVPPVTHEVDQRDGADGADGADESQGDTGTDQPSRDA
jgi:preprotein translocase subunit YajC